MHGVPGSGWACGHVAHTYAFPAHPTRLHALEGWATALAAVAAGLQAPRAPLSPPPSARAQGIIKEILTKVKACEAEVKDMEEEQREAVTAKNEALAALDKARTDMVRRPGQGGAARGRLAVTTAADKEAWQRPRV
jgi:hypothetical protein